MNSTLIRTISIKLDVDGHESTLTETQKHFNEAASWIASVCWDERISNTNTAHHRVYGETRSRFGLGAQLAVCARAKAMERRDERAFPARITFAQRARLEAGVSDVATSAARNSHLREEFGAAFVNRNFVRGIGFCARDRREETSRAPTNDRDFFRHC